MRETPLRDSYDLVKRSESPPIPSNRGGSSLKAPLEQASKIYDCQIQVSIREPFKRAVVEDAEECKEQSKEEESQQPPEKEDKEDDMNVEKIVESGQDSRSNGLAV